MLSQSRIYLFNTTYKGQKLLSISEANELAGLLAYSLKESIPELEYMNIQFINGYKRQQDGEVVVMGEVHINKLKYEGSRVLDKDKIILLNRKLKKALADVNEFEYEVIDLVNDEFTKQPSVGFMTEVTDYV